MNEVNQEPTQSNRRIWLLLFSAVTVVGVAVGLLVGSRGGLEELTAERLAEAKRRWAEAGPGSYTMSIELGGGEAVRYEVTVENGTVTNMRSSGGDTPERTWTSWSVEGLFAFLETELGNAANPQRAYGVEDPAKVILRAKFDEQLGYPAVFMRHVIGTRLQVQWEVKAFNPSTAR